MHKTELLFFVTAIRDAWIIRSEEESYGPFETCRAAFDRAVIEARAAGAYGFASAVFVRSSVGGPFEAGWTLGCDAPPALVASSGPN